MYWQDGAKSAPAAISDVNIRIHLSARKSGITEEKVAAHMTPMLRCTAAKSLRRRKTTKNPAVIDFANGLFG